ncbi:protein Asterix, partial [Geospiza fortis]|uniref:PAT complex subunit Asterix n=1 Tax=Geospiza fortis TaxID=48883 RepID=A0A6I9ZEE4_GEOFO
GESERAPEGLGAIPGGLWALLPIPGVPGPIAAGALTGFSRGSHGFFPGLSPVFPGAPQLKWCAWIAVYCSFISFANSRSSEDTKQMMSSFMLSISAVVMSYLQNPQPMSPPW